MASKQETKITIWVARMSKRRATSKLPPGLPSTPGYKMEQVSLFQYKHLKLGLNMQLIGDKVVVNYTTPDTVSHITLNIGETILAVDEKVVSSLETARQLILDGCNSKGYADLIVEYPMTDPMKNLLPPLKTKETEMRTDTSQMKK
uniref:PDZ domain-containing protein n=1 Tax=Caenorhabditis tropicalis TaxID=1561998 RepID=A0A1I7U2L0_9PELO